MRLRIFVDLDVPPSALTLLCEGAVQHTLLLPAKPTASVLAQAHRDPQFATAEIAFGQPDVEMIAEASGLKWVHVSSSGITRYDTPEFRQLAARRALLLSNSAHVYDYPCALHALSFLLAEARNLAGGLGVQVPGGSPVWEALRASSVPLEGQRVLLVGYGAMGSRLLQLLAPLNMRVSAYRRKARDNETIPIATSAGELRAALASADHVFNLLPASAETVAFFDAARFACFKPGAVFYNLGRGVTVDQDALLLALRSRQLKAAWLDVTEPEPLPAGHPLLAEPRCHITPHVAGGHAGEAESLVRHFLFNLRRFERGESLLDRVL